MYALVFKHLSVMRYLIETIRVNAKLCLRDPAHSGEYSEVSPQYEVRSKCFAVRVAIFNQDMPTLQYLVNNLHQLWSYAELEVILQELSSLKEPATTHVWLEAILKSKTFESIFVNRCFKHQIELLTKLTRGDLFEVHDTLVKQVIDQQLSQSPFSSAYLVVTIRNKSFKKKEKVKQLLRRSPKEIVQNQKPLFLSLVEELRA